MRTCVFCPRPADSREHIWSEWILRLLPEAKSAVFTRRFPDGTTKSWPAKKPVLSSALVCETACNNGWMSDLEGTMKAATEDIILADKRKIFSPQECATIAAWAFKTTVLANHLDLEGEPYFSTEQRYGFARDLTIPNGVQVWIAQRDAGHLTATWRSTHRIQQPETPLAPYLTTLPVSPYRFEHYTCTFVVGFLLLQVIAVRWTDSHVRQRLDYPTITQAKAFDKHAIPIWPNTRSAHWPPPLPINNQLMEIYWDRFDKFTLPSWMASP